jgi:hypothetical protein
MTDLDDDLLQELTRRTAAARASLGLRPDGRASLPPPTLRGRAGEATGSLGEAILARAPALPPGDDTSGDDGGAFSLPGIALENGKLVVRGAFACRGGCGQNLPFPGVCGSCAVDLARRAREDLARLRVFERLPDEFQDVTWADLPKLRNRTDTGPRVCLDFETLPVLRRELEASLRAVLRGPNGCGKSTLAACWLRAALDDGVDGLFVPAIALEDTEEGRAVCAQAAAVPRLVLDDLAGELFAAPARGGVAAIRIRMVAKLLRVRFSAGRRTVITTEKSRTELEDVYTEGITRGIFDGALDVPLNEESNESAR